MKTSSWCLGSVECETKQLNVYHGAGLCSQVFCIAAAPLKAGWGCEQMSSRDGSKSIIKPRYSIPSKAHGSFSDPAAHNEAPNTGNHLAMLRMKALGRGCANLILLITTGNTTASFSYLTSELVHDCLIFLFLLERIR